MMILKYRAKDWRCKYKNILMIVLLVKIIDYHFWGIRWVGSSSGLLYATYRMCSIIYTRIYHSVVPIWAICTSHLLTSRQAYGYWAHYRRQAVSNKSAPAITKTCGNPCYTVYPKAKA